MVIHFYQQFFCGPQSPGSLTPRKLVRLLADRGHRVTVLSGDFNVYSEQDEPPEVYQSASGGGGYQVRRFASPRRMRANLRRRLATYVTFALKAGWAGLRLERPDVVVGSIQPLFTGWAALNVARRKRAPFLLEIVDLWPDALEAKGAVTGWKARGLYRLANALYRGADRLVSLTPGIKIELLKKGLDPARIDVFPNGFDPALYDVPPGTRERVRAEMGWDKQFVALYTGTHVEVTAIDVIVRAAAALRDRKDIRFDLFGQGQRKPDVMRLAQELGLSNIHFHDPVPKPRIPHLLAAADVALMTLFRSPLIHIYFENKFMDYMGAGKPILAAMGGQQAEIIQRFRTGRVVEAFDHEGLARLVAEAAADYAPFAEMGRNGQRLVQEHLLLPDILERYADVIEAVAERRADRIPAWDPLARSNSRCS